MPATSYLSCGRQPQELAVHPSNQVCDTSKCRSAACTCPRCGSTSESSLTLVIIRGCTAVWHWQSAASTCSHECYSTSTSNMRIVVHSPIAIGVLPSAPPLTKFFDYTRVISVFSYSATLPLSCSHSREPRSLSCTFYCVLPNWCLLIRCVHCWCPMPIPPRYPQIIHKFSCNYVWLFIFVICWLSSTWSHHTILLSCACDCCVLSTSNDHLLFKESAFCRSSICTRGYLPLWIRTHPLPHILNIQYLCLLSYSKLIN